MDKRGNTAAQKTGNPSSKDIEYRLTEGEKPPGKVIALLNQKGGAGKTTLATHLAGEFALTGSRVTLLDADPQGSALIGHSGGRKAATVVCTACLVWRGTPCTRKRRKSPCRRISW